MLNAYVKETNKQTNKKKKRWTNEIFSATCKWGLSASGADLPVITNKRCVVAFFKSDI